MSKVNELSATEFESEVAQSSEPVVVDFSAEWCGPCRTLAPVFDRVAQQFEGRVKFLKCDIDTNNELAEKFGVMKIPNLLFFKNGQVVDQSVGYINEAELSAKVTDLAGE